MKNSIKNQQALYDYLVATSVRDTPVLKRLRDETAKMEWGIMQISPDQGQLMALLIQLMRAQKAIEIGTFTGYSALCIAGALPDHGKLVACDTNEEWTNIAKKYWEEAGVAHKIDLRLGHATQTLNQLIDDGESGTFDFAFIDADKQRYDTYYELCLTLLGPGGLIIIDNIFWGGKVADPTIQDDSTKSIRELSQKIKEDTRVDISMLPVGDGILLARKKEP